MLIGIDASRAFSSFIGGPENYSYYLVKALLKAKLPHFFRLYLRPDSSKSPRFKSFFTDLTTTNYELRIIPWTFLWTQAGLALECLRRPPDVLFVPAHTIPIVRPKSLKTVVTIHDLGAQFLPNYHKFPQKYYLNFATEYAIHHATKVIAVSNYTAGDVQRNFKCPSSKIEVAHEGYDRSLFYPRSEPEIGKVKEKYEIGGSYFLFVGTIQPRKNLARLIEAYSALINNYQLKINNLPQLVLAGSPGWLYEEIYRAPERFGIKDRVHFLGRVEDSNLPALMTGSTAFVFPSLYEGFGLSLLEALACGAVTIASKTTSLPEVGGGAPFYVDPYSLGEITDALFSSFKMNQEERARKREQSLIQASKFSWESSANGVLSIINSI